MSPTMPGPGVGCLRHRERRQGPGPSISASPPTTVAGSGNGASIYAGSRTGHRPRGDRRPMAVKPVITAKVAAYTAPVAIGVSGSGQYVAVSGPDGPHPVRVEPAGARSWGAPWRRPKTQAATGKHEGCCAARTGAGPNPARIAGSRTARAQYPTQSERETMMSQSTIPVLYSRPHVQIDGPGWNSSDGYCVPDRELKSARDGNSPRASGSGGNPWPIIVGGLSPRRPPAMGAGLPSQVWQQQHPTCRPPLTSHLDVQHILFWAVGRLFGTQMPAGQPLHPMLDANGRAGSKLRQMGEDAGNGPSWPAGREQRIFGLSDWRSQCTGTGHERRSELASRSGKARPAGRASGGHPGLHVAAGSPFHAAARTSFSRPAPGLLHPGWELGIGPSPRRLRGTARPAAPDVRPDGTGPGKGTQMFIERRQRFGTHGTAVCLVQGGP